MRKIFLSTVKFYLTGASGVGKLRPCPARGETNLLGEKMSYQELALRTKSDAFFGDFVEASDVAGMLRLAYLYSQRLDVSKKTLFYGKGVDSYHSERHERNGYGIVDAIGLDSYPESKDYLHAVMGIVTEAGELAKTVVDVTRQAPGVDRENAIEEIGDVLWYIAIACDALGVNIEDAMRANIAKLKSRYPERFTESNALIRDSELEMAAIKGEIENVG